MGRVFRPALGGLAALPLAILLAGAPARAQGDDEVGYEDEYVDAYEEDEPRGAWRFWDAVRRFRGEAVFEEWATIDYVVPGSRDHDGNRAWASASFVLEREAVAGVGQTTSWRGVHLAVSGGESLRQDGRSTTGWHKASREGTYAAVFADPGVMTLSLNHETGYWETMSPAALERPFRVSGRYWAWSTSTGRTETGSIDQTSSSTAAIVFSGEAPRQLLPLHAAFARDNEDADRGERSHAEGRITLYPEYDDFELVVTIPGRDTWRPLGSIEDPAVPGNSLVARAELRPKGPMTGPPPRGKRITFALLRTSREPGVCMNWPYGAGGRRDARAEAEGIYEGEPASRVDRTPDLRLAVEDPSWGRPGEEGQTLEVANPPVTPEKLPFAAARIESLDFGGRADLRVTCELEDGRVFLGSLEGAPPTAVTIPLPKREPGAWIATSWLEKQNAAGMPDDDDGEDEPPGDGASGDGLTLYEEYRGFAAGGRHVEGDPERKDFFVQNQMGAAAQGGIDLFAQLTGLRVHDKLTEAEMGFRERIMNGNRREGPNRVDQHGVFIVEDDSVSGAAAAFWDGTGRGRPGLTKGIRVSPESVTGETLEQNVTEADRARALDRAVAHELLHTVGVEHHGEGAEWYRFVLRAPGDPANPADRPIFTWGHPVRVLHEETGEDMAEVYAAGWGRSVGGELVRGSTLEERLREEAAQMESQLQTIMKNWRMNREDARRKLEEINNRWGWDFLIHERFLVGMPGDEHSGDDACVMRYYFADIYRARGQDDLFYYVPAGTEPAGLGLCTEARGRGVNDGGRAPQSRYGDARNGACKESFRVNDAAQ